MLVNDNDDNLFLLLKKSRGHVLQLIVDDYPEGLWLQQSNTQFVIIW